MGSIQGNWSPYKRKFEHRHAQRKDHVEIEEDGHLQAKRKGLK